MTWQARGKTPQDGWISVVYWSCWPQTRAIWQKVFKSDYITDRQKIRVWLRIPWLRSILQSIKVITGLVIWFGTLKVWHEERTSMLIGINMCLEWLLMITSLPVNIHVTRSGISSPHWPWPAKDNCKSYSTSHLSQCREEVEAITVQVFECAQTTAEGLHLEWLSSREMVAMPSLK